MNNAAVDALRAAWTRPQVRAFAQAICVCEGTVYPDGTKEYGALYGWRPGRADRVVTSFADHPRIRFHFDGTRFAPGEVAIPYQYTTAAGPYQATATTWDRFIRDCGPRDFSPPNQDLFCVWCLADAVALGALLRGDLTAALHAASPIWASLPFSTAGQNKRTVEFATRAYRDALQREETIMANPERDEPATPQPAPAAASPSFIETAATIANAATPVVAAFNPVAGLALALLKNLATAFAPLAQQKLAAELNRHTDDPAIGNTVADSIMQTLRQATNAPDIVAAAAKAKASPVLLQQAEAITMAKLDELAPMFDRIAQYETAAMDRAEASMNAAASRMASSPEAREMGLLLGRWSMYAMLGATFALAGALAIQIWLDPQHRVDATLATLLGGALATLYQNFGQLFNFMFGQPPESQAAAQAIAELKARRTT